MGESASAPICTKELEWIVQYPKIDKRDPSRHFVRLHHLSCVTTHDTSKMFGWFHGNLQCENKDGLKLTFSFVYSNLHHFFD